MDYSWRYSRYRLTTMTQHTWSRSDVTLLALEKTKAIKMFLWHLSLHRTRELNTYNTRSRFRKTSARNNSDKINVFNREWISIDSRLNRNYIPVRKGHGKAQFSSQEQKTSQYVVSELRTHDTLETWSMTRSESWKCRNSKSDRDHIVTSSSSKKRQLSSDRQFGILIMLHTWLPSAKRRDQSNTFDGADQSVISSMSATFDDFGGTLSSSYLNV